MGYLGGLLTILVRKNGAGKVLERGGGPRAYILGSQFWPVLAGKRLVGKKGALVGDLVKILAVLVQKNNGRRNIGKKGGGCTWVGWYFRQVKISSPHLHVARKYG